jgi:hypothetical protein
MTENEKDISSSFLQISNIINYFLLDQAWKRNGDKEKKRQPNI